MKNFVFLLAFFVTTTFGAQAKQTGDSTLRKNTIKLDITSYWLYRNAVVFSYERVVKPYQSLGITVGYQEFPRILSIGSNITSTKDESARGYKYAAEYRFYLQQDNKFKAPRGVYLGPYASLLNFKNTRYFDVTNSNGDVESAIMNSRVDILNIGVQLGYQFVLNNRWTIDLVFIGPSVSNYRAKFTLDGYTGDPEEIINAITEALIEEYPGFSELITDKEFSDSGKIDTWAYGYRYQFQIGYHFGRKKK
jgi:hypothetical protein